jgi:hypothetical protein
MITRENLVKLQKLPQDRYCHNDYLQVAPHPPVCQHVNFGFPASAYKCKTEKAFTSIQTIIQPK